MPLPNYNFGYTYNQRYYVQAEASLAVMTGRMSSANAMRAIECAFKPMVETIRRPDVTGTRSEIEGDPGHKSGTWSIKWSLAPGSAPGNLPDAHPIFDAFFGAAGTQTSGSDVTWRLVDGVPKSFALARYLTPASLLQQIAIGCVGGSMKFTLGQNVALAEASGPALWVMDSIEFPTLADGDPGRGGFTASQESTLPPEPSGQTYNGSMIQGYKGFLSIGGSNLIEFEDSVCGIDPLTTLPLKVYGSDYGTIPVAGKRKSYISLNMFASDSAGQQALWGLAKSKTPVDVIQEVGVALGARYRITYRNVQFEVPEQAANGDRFSVRVAESLATISGSTANEIELKLY